MVPQIFMTRAIEHMKNQASRIFPAPAQLQGSVVKDIHFLFFVFNCRMHWSLLEDAKRFFKKNPQYAHLTVNKLHDELFNAHAGQVLAQRLACYISSLVGLAPYWYQ
jgi:hypothetical protein